MVRFDPEKSGSVNLSYFFYERKNVDTRPVYPTSTEPFSGSLQGGGLAPNWGGLRAKGFLNVVPKHSFPSTKYIFPNKSN